MKEQIEVSLEYLDKQVDLAIPSNVTASRLIVLLTQTFQSLGQPLPAKWYFLVKSKSIALNNGFTLKELGLGNGDILQLIIGEEDEL
ncbi:MAG: EsaB/YukD family protein [Streptococcaceae bacterium]|jgi:uncharacterized ubiquitin-like protein YukD|nr:EsaB/YukD family protein [Streptococcaceae bacterium]